MDKTGVALALAACAVAVTAFAQSSVYKWAEVLSADAYGAFEENGVLDPGTGARFRREVLASGGSRPALESFVAFRGRKPQIDALLRHNGMTANA